MRDVSTTQGTLLALLISVCCGALIAGQNAPAASQATETPSPLELGTPIDREISGRKQHAYEVALKAGEYADVIVEQRGIDVVVAVFDASGKLIAEFDADSRTDGRERAGVVAESASGYRVEDPRAILASAGRPLRSPGERDPARDRPRSRSVRRAQAQHRSRRA